MTRRLSLLTVAAALVGTAPASAASVNVAVSPDPLIDRPVTFTTQAVTDGRELFVYAKIRPRDANPCAATFSAETGSSLFFRQPGGAVVARTFDAAGPLLVCAYLSEASGDAPVASRAIAVDVRGNRAALAIRVPPRVTQGTAAAVTFLGVTEVPRNLYARTKPAGAGGCGPTYLTDAGSGSFTFGRELSGGFGLPETTPTLRNTGPQVVCAWLQRRSDSPVADATATAAFTVVPPAPTLSEIRLGSSRFRALTFGGALTRSVRGGTSVAVTVDTPSTVRFTVGKAKGGRRVGSRCLASTRARRDRRPCTRFVRLKGSFLIDADRTEIVRFSGRIGGRQLARGRYRIYAVARNTTGRSIVRKRTFRIVGR